MTSDNENSSKWNSEIDLLSHISILVNRKISSAIDERPKLKARLEQFDPLKSAALVAGLLTEPSLHANTLRVELLVHLLIAFAAGHRTASRKEIHTWINDELKETKFALFEDPPEDVFVSNVTTPIANFRLFEGIWEGNDFYLQRILNIVDTLPDNNASKRLKREIVALLRLGDAVAARRGLTRYCAGGGHDKTTARIPSTGQLNSLRQGIIFSAKDLNRLTIELKDLEPFLFRLTSRHKLREQTLGDTDLERLPLIQHSGQWIVLLPTALGVAVRHRVLIWMLQYGYKDGFDRALVAEYRNFLATTPILGTRIPRGLPLLPIQVAKSNIIESSTEVDAGRYLQLIAIVDTLAGFQEYGLSRPESTPSELTIEIETRIEKARKYFRARNDFKHGLTLLVSCGYGRPRTCRVPGESTDWTIESVSAPDIEILASIPTESPLFLWRLLEQERFLRRQGVSIVNPNGLLNLYGWWTQTNYMMLGQQIEFDTETPLNLLIPTDCLASVRTRVRQGWDNHIQPLPNGSMARVIRKAFDSCFREDHAKPSYGCMDEAIAGKLLGAYVGKRLVWWVRSDPEATKLSRDLVYRVWDAVSNWLDKAVPVFEEDLDLNAVAVLIALDFSNTQEMPVEPASDEVLRSCLSVSVESEISTIRIVFHDPFFGAFSSPRNIGEREILRALTGGVLTLAKRASDDLTLCRLLDAIIPNEDARHLHFFKSAHFRDDIRGFDRPESLFVDQTDNARCMLGLGWQVRNRKDGPKLTTQVESVQFLNSVVDVIWQRMLPKLHVLDRLSMIEESLRYIEGVEAGKLQWERTARAVVALRNDKDAAIERVAQEIARFNTATISLRLVIEMAISECPLKGGLLAGALDLQSMMSDALFLFHFGGCSDAIQKGVMEPEIQIAPNGEILTHSGFRDEIMDPFGRRFAMSRLEQETSSYEKHFEWTEAVPSVQNIFPAQFWNAVREEFGLSIDELRGFRDALERWALEQQKSVFVASKEEIISYCASCGLTCVEVARVALDELALWPRKGWVNTPKGFKTKDWYPWRFGRRLSLIWRPFLRLEESQNPRYVISPGLIGTNLMHVLRLHYEGLVPTDQCKTNAMKRWVGDEVNQRGHSFANKVFTAMRSFGYEAYLEVKIDSLVNEKLMRDFGDVDVFAWRPGGRRLLVIECKDLRLAKTPNEVAEQLNHFTGQMLPNGERDDLLKHVERCRLLKERNQILAEKIGLLGKPIEIEPIVCFSNPVPMQYVKTRVPGVTFLSYQELESSLVINEN